MWTLEWKATHPVFHRDPRLTLTPEEVGQLGSLLRVFVVRISDSEPVGGDSWCWKALRHGGWVALMGYAQEETAEEAWDLGAEREGAKERVRLFCMCGGEKEG